METDDLPLVATKYSTFSKDGAVAMAISKNGDSPSHLLTKVCRQQLGLILEWCSEQGVECFEDTHRHTIVTKNTADIDEFRMAKDDFFKSIGVDDIDQMNCFSQSWDGFKVESMDQLVVKFDTIDRLEIIRDNIDDHLDNIDDAVSQARGYVHA